MNRSGQILTALLVTLSLSTAASASGQQRKKAPTRKSRTTQTATGAGQRGHAEDAGIGALMDQILMLRFGGGGSTEAHMFIEDSARYGGGQTTTAEHRLWHARGSYRKFKGPKNDGSIIVMFADHSGAYIHPDGFVTPMGENIAHEVGQWEEIK
jgi:hypothetical protein